MSEARGRAQDAIVPIMKSLGYKVVPGDAGRGHFTFSAPGDSEPQTDCVRLALAYLSALRRLNEARKMVAECRLSLSEVAAEISAWWGRYQQHSEREREAQHDLKRALAAQGSSMPLAWTEDPEIRQLLSRRRSLADGPSSDFNIIIRLQQREKRARSTEAAAIEKEAFAKEDTERAYRDLADSLRELGYLLPGDGPEETIGYVVQLCESISIRRSGVFPTEDQAADVRWLFQEHLAGLEPDLAGPDADARAAIGPVARDTVNDHPVPCQAPQDENSDKGNAHEQPSVTRAGPVSWKEDRALVRQGDDDRERRSKTIRSMDIAEGADDPIDEAIAQSPLSRAARPPADEGRNGRACEIGQMGPLMAEAMPQGPIVVPTLNDDRDRFIYDQYLKKTPIKSILGTVNATDGWGRLGSETAALKAMERYCKRNGLAKPTRKPRRNRQK